jgi:diacylglycerol kinase family enzyme
MSRRAGAILALLGGAGSLAVSAYVFLAEFPRGLFVFACVLAALLLAWIGILRRGPARLAAIVPAALALGVALGLVLNGGNAWALALVAVAFAAAMAGARAALRPERSLPRAEPPSRPVLFVNPRSGEGRAEQLGLAAEARRRGYEVVELSRGDDLDRLAREAVGRGADGLAMAGGDGSQAVLAAVAAEHDLPYACIPSGTRNHFALDLGVDREDAVGALDALLDGGERYVDLGEVNGRVFVNNVSLGVYAEAVGQERYRGAKLRTMLDTLAGSLGPEGEPQELRWRDPEGAEQTSTALILVSNNPYLLGPTLGSGTRPRLDAGLLGIVDFHPPIPDKRASGARWRELAAPELVIEAQGPVPVGIDGEAAELAPPLRFAVRRGALRARIARRHPGASPSADVARGPVGLLGQLLRAALARPDAR